MVRKRKVPDPGPPAQVYEPFSEAQLGSKTVSRPHTGNTPGNPLGPVSNSRQHSHHASHHASIDAADLGNQDEPPLQPSGEPSAEQHSESRTEKERARLDLNWRKAMHGKRKELFRLSPQYAAWHREECAQRQDTLQKRINEAYKHHTVHCEGCEGAVPEARDVLHLLSRTHGHTHTHTHTHTYMHGHAHMQAHTRACTRVHMPGHTPKKNTFTHKHVGLQTWTYTNGLQAGASL